MTITSTDAMKPLAVSVREAGRLLGVGKDTVYRLIAAGTLRKLPLDGPVRVTVASLERLVDQAEEADAATSEPTDGGEHVPPLRARRADHGTSGSEIGTPGPTQTVARGAHRGQRSNASG